MMRFQTGQHDTRRHSLDVPFPRPRYGFVKIVYVEDYSGIGSFKGSEVLDVRIATELNCQTGMRLGSEIGCHD